VKIELSQHFIEQYKKLPAAIRRKTDKTLLSLTEADFRSPGLQSQKIEGAPGIFAAFVDAQYHLTFERGSSSFILRNIDNIEDCLRNISPKRSGPGRKKKTEN
jgi:hypothetical protein